MRIAYDPEVDAIYISLIERTVHVRTSEAVSPETVLDFDAEGNLVGIEVWARATERVDLSSLTTSGFQFGEVVRVE